MRFDLVVGREASLDNPPHEPVGLAALELGRFQPPAAGGFAGDMSSKKSAKFSWKHS